MGANYVTSPGLDLSGKIGTEALCKGNCWAVESNFGTISFVKSLTCTQLTQSNSVKEIYHIIDKLAAGMAELWTVLDTINNVMKFSGLIC